MEHESSEDFTISSITETNDYTETMQQSIDLLGEHYMEQITLHVNNNDKDSADAIFKEFVVDGVDPEDGSYEWLFLDEITVSWANFIILTNEHHTD